ncbi:TonB-dependent receptor [Flagellimonas sp. S3867]|uniref:TonB-dependent receptor n=1 Tax=Flagellimonas sp. S3867 TaxID=2768063 RepID=UPI0016889427|nr:TonB-dependent receptor [Flagellimonas sp. S3867]
MKQLYTAMLLALCPLYFYAQNTISGTITNSEDGEPLVGVSVYMPKLEKGAVTEDSGTYTIKNLPEGKYKLIISYLGFETHSIEINVMEGENHFSFQMVPSAIEIDEVVLSTPFHKLQRENVMKVEQKTIAELKSNGAITLADGITNIPGVASVSTGVGIGKPVIRGLSANRVVVYTQGIRLENQQFGDEHGLGINDAGISSVEVIKGPASLLYGSDALGGVLYLNPESFELPDNTSGDINLNYLTNTAGYGTNAGFKTSSEKFRFLIRGAHNSNADYQTGNDVKVTNSRFRETDIKTGLGYQSTKFKTELRYNYNDSDLGIPEEIGVQNRDRSPLLPNQEIKSHILSSKSNFFLKNSSLQAIFGYTFNDRKEFEEHHEEGEPEPAEEEEEEGPALFMELSTFNYNLQFNPQWGSITTIFGVQGMHQKNENFGEEVLIPDAITNDFGVLVTSHIHFNKSDLQLGVRYDLRSINGEQNGTMGEEGFINAISRDFNNFNIAAGYRVDVTKNILARLNLATGFRAPNLSELTSNGTHEGTNRFEIGDPNLKSERNFQIDLALEYQNKHVEVYANAFLNNVDNFIFIEPNGEFVDEDPVFLYTQQDATLYGGEFGLHFHPHPLDWLHYESSFDIVIGELKNDTPLPLIPANRWTNTLRVEWDSFQGVKTKSYAFVTLQSVFDQNKVSTFETNTPGYSLVNMGVGGEIKIFDQAVGIKISGNNLFDKNYISHLSRLKTDGIANIGRNVAFNLSIPL